MKVGIMTFPNSESHGAELQMFALYQVCRELGYDTEIINYHNQWMKHEKHLTYSQKGSKAAWGKKVIRDLLHQRMKAEFKVFENQMQKYPSLPTSDKKKLRELGERYGAVICGSDQVWNPDITNYDLSYFLDFCGSDTSRISYAPSFGVETISEEYGAQIRGELEKFDSISVRENTGRRIIMQLTGANAQLVLDPTFLINADQWFLYEKAQPQAKEAYILYYTIRGSKTLWNHCQELSKKTNMKILRIGSNAISKHLKKTDDVEYVCDVGPAEWLYLIHNASYVVTNSFHGTAFSINYRKNFYVEFSSLTNSRLAHIVSLLGLEDRVLKEDSPIIPSATDYSQTEMVLPKLKEESAAFLKHSLQRAVTKQKD